MRDSWPTCEFHGDLPATHYELDGGCEVCGGSDCGDSPRVYFYCDDCADDFDAQKIPLIWTAPFKSTLDELEAIHCASS